jgi:hypothetical protein
MDECMDRLFVGLSRYHGLDSALADSYRLQRNAFADATILLAFSSLYALAAYFAAGVVLRRFSPDGVAATLVAVVCVALVCGVAGAMAYDLWSGVIEGVRLGSGHLSYRGERIPWSQSTAPLFVGVALFLVTALIRYAIDARRDARSAFEGRAAG